MALLRYFMKEGNSYHSFYFEVTGISTPCVQGVWLSIPQPRKYFHELAKNSLLTKILPPEKYPLYGILLLQYLCYGADLDTDGALREGSLIVAQIRVHQSSAVVDVRSVWLQIVTFAELQGLDELLKSLNEITSFVQSFAILMELLC